MSQKKTRDLLLWPDRRREADALDALRGNVLQAFKRKREVDAALIPGEGVYLSHNDRFGRGKKSSRAHGLVSIRESDSGVVEYVAGA